MSAARLTAAEFPDAGSAAARALDAVIEAHAFAHVVSLALSTDAGLLTPSSQEAVWAVTQHAVAKLGEARDAIDIAGGMFREARR